MILIAYCPRCATPTGTTLDDWRGVLLTPRGDPMAAAGRTDGRWHLRELVADDVFGRVGAPNQRLAWRRVRSRDCLSAPWSLEQW